MALIRCPDCGHSVSNQARACPSCGYPLREVEYRTHEVITLALSKLAARPSSMHYWKTVGESLTKTAAIHGLLATGTKLAERFTDLDGNYSYSRTTTNRWTGAARTAFRMNRDRAKLPGTPPGQLNRSVALQSNMMNSYWRKS
jgi:hypothetical protein